MSTKQSRLSRFFPGINTEPTAELDENGDPVEVKIKRPKLFTTAEKEKVKKDVSELYEQKVPQLEIVERQQKLEELFERMRSDADLPLVDTLGTESKWVTQRGRVNAALMIVGEAPGANEAKTGKPFVGASGKLLDDHLREAGIDPEKHIYVTNLVKIRPAGNRDPSFEEIRAYLPILREQIDIVQPRMILCMGRFSSTVLYSGLKVTDSMLGDSHPKAEHQHQLKVLNMGKLYRATSNSSALYLPEKRVCYRTYYSYHPSAVLYDKDGSRGYADKWKMDFAKISQLLLKPPLKYINEIDFLGDKMDLDFPYTQPDTVYYTRNPMSNEAQQHYFEQLPERTFEMQIHMVDYFSWRNEFEVQGRTREGLSTHLIVKMPENFFYVWSKEMSGRAIVVFVLRIEHLTRMANALIEELAHKQGRVGQNVWVKLEMVQKRSYLGYHPHRKPHLMITHSHNSHKYELKRMFESILTKPKFFETNFKPTLRFLLSKNAYYFGWLLAATDSLMTPQSSERRSTCDLEFSVNYCNIAGVSPAPGEAGDVHYEELAQYRVISVDMEMLNPEESFPAADQNPIVSICAYTQRYNQGNLLLEQLRDPKDITKVKFTGRSNYDDAVAFCVASVNNIDVPEFTASALPNAPELPAVEIPVLRRGRSRKTGKYKKKYMIAIRTWNEYIGRFAEWIKFVGTSRCNVVYYNQELLGKIKSLRKRPDGISGGVWPDQQCEKWEHIVDYIVTNDKKRYTGDIGDLSNHKSNEEEYWIQIASDAQAEASSVLETEQDYEEFYGLIQYRWALFNKEKRVFCYATEADMLRGCRNYVVQYDPDMITGYNVENFDLSYYIRRVQLLDIRNEANSKLISLGRVRDREDWVSAKTSKTRAHGERDFSEVHIPGRDVFDLLNIFLNETYGKLDSYILAYVAQVKLGDTKHDVPYSAIPSLFKNNRERLNDYCLKDAELPPMLMNYLTTTNFLISYGQLVGTIPFGQLVVQGMQAKVFSGFIRFIQNEGLDKIFPDVNIYSAGNEPCGFSDDSGYVGAHVFEPRCGLIVKLVWVLDFASLYPNIMRDWNIGHDVMGPKKMWDKLNIDCEDPKLCTKTKKQYLNPKTGVFEYFYILVPRKLFASQLTDAGYVEEQCYKSKKKMLNEATGKQEFYYTPKIDVAALCGKLTKGLEGRSALKKKMAQYSPWEEAYKIINSQQECLKLDNNSTYGACGAAVGKLAGKMLSEFVTMEGKDMVLRLAEDLKEKYHVEITGELNQVFDPFVDPETGMNTCLADQIEGFINNRLPEYSSIELEKCYYPSFMVAKKRGMYIEHLPYYDKIEGRMKFNGVGSLESKGLETKRRDSCTIAKDTIYGYAERLLRIAKEGDVPRAKRESVKFVAEQVKKINNQGVPFHQMIQARKLTSSNYTNQNLPHLQVVRKMAVTPPLSTRVPFIIVSGRKGIKRYQAAVYPDEALRLGLQPDLKYIIDTKIYKPIARFCKWFNNPEDEPGEGEGDKMLREIFGSSFKVHKSNLLDEDEIARFVKPLLPCMVCGADSFELICGNCKGDANFWTILCERDEKRQKLEQAYEERLKVCRACMHIQPDEEVICGNTSCVEYFPRRAAEYDLLNFDKTTQAIKDIEDTVELRPFDI